MSGQRAFAPDFGDVKAYKRGELSEQEYSRIYLQRMRQSLQENPNAWHKLREYRQVALACYCKPGAFCHRHLFADMMKSYLEKNGIKAHIEGEITPEPKLRKK